MTRSTALAGLLALSTATSAWAAGQELNIYSARHYDTDEQLYADFEEATGITINRIEGNANSLLTRMQSEGENSPADVLITVDTSRLTRAKKAGVLQSIDSDILEERIPANLQDADNQWFGFSARSRIIFYDKTDSIDLPETYMDLADPKYKGLVCIRSSKNTYNQTLLASIVTHHGEDAARDWAAGIVDNMARKPKGGDIDQLRGLVSGECELSVSNTYYFARAMRKNVKGVSEHIDDIGWIFPSQETTGAHMNLSGAGVAAHAPNKENAIKFLEYLSSSSAQVYFSQGNDEFPTVPGVPLADTVSTLGSFKADDVLLSDVAENLPTALKIFNEVGWQ